MAMIELGKVEYQGGNTLIGENPNSFNYGKQKSPSISQGAFQYNL
jgi:hypothetical protein